VNAYWDGQTMNYGDGDNRTASILTTIDIAGHEIHHGLTEHTAGLIYWGESGGLNEAFSDIGGFMTEWYAAQQNPAVIADWKMGEDCWTPHGDPNDALRYMDNPTKDGYSVDNYANYPEQTEVHGSSGIANHAFYQLAETNNANKVPNSVSGIAVQDGIGPEKAAKIFIRGLIHYMRPSTTFSEARGATIQAAIDLYGADSVEVQKTRESWSAVGVEDKNTIPPKSLAAIAVNIVPPAERGGAKAN
jgi:Zn-dependent metalloprotease